MWLSVTLLYGLVPDGERLKAERYHAGRSAKFWLFFGFVGGWLLAAARQHSIDPGTFLAIDVAMTAVLAGLVGNGARGGVGAAVRRLGPGLLAYQVGLLVTAACIAEILAGASAVAQGGIEAAGTLVWLVRTAVVNWQAVFLAIAGFAFLWYGPVGNEARRDPPWVAYLPEEAVARAKKRLARNLAAEAERRRAEEKQAAERAEQDRRDAERRERDAREREKAREEFLWNQRQEEIRQRREEEKRRNGGW